MRVVVKNHALPVYKKNRLASLLCIFESTIYIFLCGIVCNRFVPSNYGTKRLGAMAIMSIDNSIKVYPSQESCG